MSTTEIEAKFMLPHLADMRQTVLSMGGHMISPRILERNIRFDDSDGKLHAEHKILRLRQDKTTRLTYKEKIGSSEIRLELEVEVDDFDRAFSLLEALGFQPKMTYEKYRQVFMLMGALVMMDELPFGSFVEIEADSLDRVRELAEKLGLIWDRRSQSTYLQLFDCLRGRRGFKFTDATFANFEGVPPAQPQELGLSYGSEA